MEEFWSMTVAELRIANEARSDMWKEETERMAWHAANIMNMWVSKGKSIKPRDLLPWYNKREEFIPGLHNKADIISIMRKRKQEAASREAENGS